MRSTFITIHLYTGKKFENRVIKKNGKLYFYPTLHYALTNLGESSIKSYPLRIYNTKLYLDIDDS